MEAFSIVGKIALKGNKEVNTKLDKLQGKMKKVGESFKTVGGNLTKFLTVPLAGVGAGAVAVSTEMSGAQRQIQNQLGVTAEEAEALKDTAKEVWKQGFGQNMGEIAGKVATITQRIKNLDKEELKNLTKGAQMLEQTFGVDVNESVNAVDTLMQNFGLSSEEAMDYVTSGFQNGLDYSGEFTDTIREYSTYFSEMGFTSDEFFTTLVKGSENGAFQLDKVGDSMKEFTLRSKDGSKLSSEAFVALGLNADTMTAKFNEGGETAKLAFQKVVTKLQGVEDETVRNQIATALFGTQYEDLGEEAFNAMLDMTGGLDNVEGSTKKATETMEQSFGQRLQGVLRDLKIALEPVGDMLLKFAEEILPKLKEKIKEVTDWFKNLSDGQKKMFLILGIGAVVLGPLIFGLGALIGIISSAIKIIRVLRTAMILFQVATLPISATVLLIIVAILALVAIGYFLWKNWDAIKEYLIALWNVIKFKAKQIFLGIKNWIIQTWTAIKTKTKEIFTGIKKWIVDTWTKIKNKTVAIFTGIRDWIVNKFTEIKNKAKSIVGGIRDWILDAWNNLKNKTKSNFEQVKKMITTPIEKAKDLVKKAIDKIKGFFTGLKNKLKINIPKPKLPHFSISGKFSLAPPRIPKIGIDWYAKGGILDTASLIGIGAGEAGKELIMPLEGRNMRGLAQTIAGEMPRSNKVGGILEAINVPVYLNGREIARATAGDLDRELEKVRRKRATFKGVTT